jgi:hypothetical protein
MGKQRQPPAWEAYHIKDKARSCITTITFQT